MKKVLLRCVFGAMRSILILITAAIALCASAICILRGAQALERLAQIAGTAVLFHNLLFLDFPIEMIYNVG